ATRHLPALERQPSGTEPLLHAAKSAARERDMMNDAGVRFLRLLGVRDIDQMHHRFAFAVHPGARKAEIRPVALFEFEHLLVEPDGVGEFSGPDVEMIEQAYAHEVAPFSLQS